MDFVMLLNYAIAFFTLFTVSVFILLFLSHRSQYSKKPKPTKWRPLVSIVIPAYNEEKYIADCLKTLLEVDYPKGKLDIIVVDDGSTDNTYEAAKAMEAENIHVFRKQNAGKGAALNFGIAKAKGELIATMDADSYLTKNTLKELMPFFADPEVMAVTPAIKIRESRSWLKEFQRVEYLLILFSRKMLSFIESVPVTPGPFSIFRASVFEKVGGFDEHNLVEDVEMALRIQAAHFKIRSSVTADVYTEPPANLPALLKQRIRWQRGGIRNYWNYRFMMKPEYGDFGMYCVPLNFASVIALFALLGLILYSFFSTPTYVQYIWMEAFGMSIGLFTFVGAFVILSSALLLMTAIKSFESEKVKLRHIISFLIFYWFFSVGYNVLFLLKELKGEKATW